MSANHRIRQVHRWLSIAFTLGAIVNLVAQTQEAPPAWLGIFAGLPLILLVGSGLYLFALPYLGKRGRQGAGEDAAAGSPRLVA
jgi:uncharacterized membrane protein AbrB (regulator of aidB expression)